MGVRFFTQQPFRLLWPPICWAVLAFVLYAIVRCQAAELPYIGAAESAVRDSIRNAVFCDREQSEPAGIGERLAAVALIAVAAGESFFAFYQFMTHYARVWAVCQTGGYT